MCCPNVIVDSYDSLRCRLQNEYRPHLPLPFRSLGIRFLLRYSSLFAGQTFVFCEPIVYSSYPHRTSVSVSSLNTLNRKDALPPLHRTPRSSNDSAGRTRPNTFRAFPTHPDGDHTALHDDHTTWYALILLPTVAFGRQTNSPTAATITQTLLTNGPNGRPTRTIVVQSFAETQACRCSPSASLVTVKVVGGDATS